MSVYENLKLVDLRNIVRSRGLGLWSQLKKVDMISFIEENDKINQTQYKELIEKQRGEIEQRYREEMKWQRREKFEQRYPKKDVIDRNSF